MSDQQHLLAYAVASYATALDHLEAIHRAGVPVRYSVLGTVKRDLTHVAMRWDALHGHHLWNDDRLPVVIEEARQHCTTHQPEIDELARREREA